MGKSAVIYEFGINLQAETMLTAKEIATQIGGILNLPETAVTITNAAKLEEGDANSLTDLLHKHVKTASAIKDLSNLKKSQKQIWYRKIRFGTRLFYSS